MLSRLPKCSITWWFTAKSMKQLFHNITAVEMYIKICAKTQKSKKKYGEVNYACYQHAPLGYGTRLGILNLIAQLCKLCYETNCFLIERKWLLIQVTGSSKKWRFKTPGFKCPGGGGGVIAVYMTGRSDIFFWVKHLHPWYFLGQEICHIIFLGLKLHLIE